MSQQDFFWQWRNRHAADWVAAYWQAICENRAVTLLERIL